MSDTERRTDRLAALLRERARLPQVTKCHYMRRVRAERKLLCVGVDPPIDAGTCGRFVHASYPCGVPQAVPLLDEVADPCLRW